MLRWLVILVVAALVACTHPPTQEMANARSAIQTARALPGDVPQADQALENAERALDEASRAIRDNNFNLAREKALAAKHSAYRAAKLKQKAKSSTKGE